MNGADIAVVGMRVMGRNLALNMEEKGARVAVYNRTQSVTDEFLAGEGKGKNLVAARSPEELVKQLKRPRKIMLMVQAGKGTDETIDAFAKCMEPGDLLIDGGNSFFQDTIRRNTALKARNLLFIGTGVSGGEEGARHGPAIMPGGQPEAYKLVEDLFKKISAHVDGEPCCTYIGPDGAGHYVKMVHNGIEYADMQLICEAYMLLKEALGLSADELHKVFAEWNQGDLDSYLIQITRDIFARKDDDGQPLVDKIMDTAGQKGTGKWTSESALDLGIPAATIAEAVFARCMSAIKSERVAASAALHGPTRKFTGDRAKFVNAIRDALYVSKICCYAQGFQLMRAAAAEYKWTLDFGGIAMIWRGGCIIRAKFLSRIKDAYDKNPNLANLMLNPYFKKQIHKGQRNLRNVVAMAVKLGIPAPAFASALSYFDSYRRERLPANLLQAQRDYFGAHTYNRIDKEGVFHTQWI